MKDLDKSTRALRMPRRNGKFVKRTTVNTFGFETIVCDCRQIICSETVNVGENGFVMLKRVFPDKCPSCNKVIKKGSANVYT